METKSNSVVVRPAPGFVHVYHYDTQSPEAPTFVETHSSNLDVVRAAYQEWTSFVRKVAVVESYPGIVADIPRLDDAWERTNSIDAHWSENNAVQAVNGLHRSSMVGDVMVLDDGRVFSVCGVGFAEIDRLPEDAPVEGWEE